MAFPQGINFRSTLAFVTDGANEDAELTGSTADYPFTTAQGNTVGWESTNFGSGLQKRDRNSGNDRRIAGTVFNNTVSDMVQFRIDLDGAGNYRVGLAAGDANYSTTTKVTLFDNNTQLAVLANGTTSAAQRFFDATGTEYTNLTWPGNQSLVQYAFASSVLRLKADGATQMLLNHFYVSKALSAAMGGYPRPNHLRPRIFAPGLVR